MQEIGRLVAHAARPAEPGDPAPAGEVELGYEARYLRRRSLDLADGRSLLVDLPEPVSLRDGDRLVLAGGGQIAVRAAPEPLAEIAAEGARLARLAWHVGNRHTPAQVLEGRLRVQRDHVLEDMLARLGAAVVHVEAPFEPEGGAYGHGRTHGHSHSHDPHANPNAHIPHRHDPV
nr:urease accessory protein UreE [Limibaculum sp. NKW23]